MISSCMGPKLTPNGGHTRFHSQTAYFPFSAHIGMQCIEIFGTRKGLGSGMEVFNSEVNRFIIKICSIYSERLLCIIVYLPVLGNAVNSTIISVCLCIGVQECS